MLDLYKASIVLGFAKMNADGEQKKAYVTLANVREDLTTDEIKQVAQAFGTLISHQMVSIEFVQYNHVF